MRKEIDTIVKNQLPFGLLVFVQIGTLLFLLSGYIMLYSSLDQLNISKFITLVFLAILPLPLAIPILRLGVLQRKDGKLILRSLFQYNVVETELKINTGSIIPFFRKIEQPFRSKLLSVKYIFILQFWLA